MLCVPRSWAASPCVIERQTVILSAICGGLLQALVEVARRRASSGSCPSRRGTRPGRTASGPRFPDGPCRRAGRCGCTPRPSASSRARGPRRPAGASTDRASGPVPRSPRRAGSSGGSAANPAQRLNRFIGGLRSGSSSRFGLWTQANYSRSASPGIGRVRGAGSASGREKDVAASFSQVQDSRVKGVRQFKPQEHRVSTLCYIRRPLRGENQFFDSPRSGRRS